MISLVTGKIGSGKTLHSLGLIVVHLSKGLTVYTNIALDFDEIAKLVARRYRKILVPAQLVYVDLVGNPSWQEQIIWGQPGAHVLCVWDEIHLFFNARDWAKTQKFHASMLSFLSQSRKACVDVIFIAQVSTTLEKQFRVQCEWEFYCRNLKDIPIPFFGALPINRMLLVQKDNESDKAISRKVLPYDRGLYPCYDTRSFLDAEMREAAENVQRIGRYPLKRVPPLSRKQFYALLVTILLVAAWLLSNHYS